MTNSTIAERLRHEASCFDTDNGSDPEADAGTARLLREAADYIDQLRKERDEALEQRDYQKMAADRVLDNSLAEGAAFNKRVSVLEDALNESSMMIANERIAREAAEAALAAERKNGDVLVALVEGKERAMLRLNPPWRVTELADVIRDWAEADPARIVSIRSRSMEGKDG